MASRFRKEIQGKKSLVNAYKLLNRFGANDDLEELLQLSNDIIDFPDNGVSGFVDKCIESNGDYSKYKRQRNKIVKNVHHLRKEVLDFVTRSCLSFDKEKSKIIYKKLLSELHEQEIPIFTTNYDGVIDYVASEEGLNIVDNFIQEGARKFWDESLSSFRKKGIKLIKMHGSIYWHANGGGRIELINPPAPLNSDGQEVERLLIVPTQFKDIYNRNYFPLYTNFLRSLGGSDILFVIGHSLRDEYLLAAIRDRLRDSNFSLIIIDPALPMKRELRSVARDPKQIIHVSQPLEKVVDLVNQLISEDSATKVIDWARNAEKSIDHNISPNIEILSNSGWLEGGKNYSVPVRIKTTSKRVRVSMSLEVGKVNPQTVSLDDSLNRVWGGEPLIEGFREVKKRIRVYLNKSYGLGPHKFKIHLIDENGGTVDSAEKSFRLKGV